MDDTRSFQRLAGWLAVLSAPLAWASLAVGLSAVQGNFDAFADARALLSLGAQAAPLIRTSFLLSMCGSYGLLVPLVLLLDGWFRPARPHLMRLYTLGGLGYCALGALGAATLAAVWPALILAYAGAPPEQHAPLLASFQLATAIAQDGMQGVIQDVLGGIWWLGLGGLLWRARRRWLGGYTTALGAFLLLNGLGIVADNELLRSVGLSANLLLAPIWALWVGVTALRAAGAPQP